MILSQKLLYKMPLSRAQLKPIRQWTHSNLIHRIWICLVSIKRLLISHLLFPVMEVGHQRHLKARLQHGVISLEEKADCPSLFYLDHSALNGVEDNAYQRKKDNISAHSAQSPLKRDMTGHDMRRASTFNSTSGSARRISTSSNSIMIPRLLNATFATLLSPNRRIGKNTSSISALQNPQQSAHLVGKIIYGSTCANSTLALRPLSILTLGVEQVPMFRVVAASATIHSPTGLLEWNT